MAENEGDTVKLELKVYAKDPPEKGWKIVVKTAWTVVTTLLLPISIAAGGWWVSNATSDMQELARQNAADAEAARGRDAQAAEDRRRRASLDVEFVKIAVGVLANPAADRSLSAWAVAHRRHEAPTLSVRKVYVIYILRSTPWVSAHEPLVHAFRVPWDVRLGVARDAAGAHFWVRTEGCLARLGVSVHQASSVGT